jgi:hypothetical protein
MYGRECAMIGLEPLSSPARNADSESYHPWMVRPHHLT